MNPLVSVILPNYNHATYLPERLASIFNQTFQNFEVIILDDCSADDSVQILKAYKRHPKTVHFEVNAQNSGSPFKQWQKGLRLAKGDFVWIAESDDYCDFDFLETQLNLIKQQDLDIVVAETKTITVGKITGRTQHPIFKEKDELEITLDSFLYCPILNVSAVVFKKELIENAIHFVNYRLIGDRVFYFEAFQNKRIALNAHTNSYFRKDGESVSSLATKGMEYLDLYYNEHSKFAYEAYRDNKIDKILYQTYMKRFFNRVNNRLTKSQKLQVAYFKLRMRYYMDLKKPR